MKHGIVTAFANRFGLPVSSAHSYLRGERRPRPARAAEMAKSSGISFETWMLAPPEEIQAAVQAWAMRNRL